MAIEKTFGPGGDYATFELLYAFLCGLGPMADDYDLDLLDTVTLDSWPDISLAANRVNHNGHSVRFHCSYNEARPTRPDLWKKIIVDGADGKITYTHDTGATIVDETTFEYFIFDHISNDANKMLIIRCWVSPTDGTTWEIKNCYFVGNGGNGIAIKSINSPDYYNIENVVIYNFKIGLQLQPSGYALFDNYPGRKIVNNVTVYTRLSGDGIIMADQPGNNIIFRNVFSIMKGGIGDAWARSVSGTSLADRFYLYNCADNDNTIITNLTVDTILTDCVANVDLDNNLQSVDSADLGDGFLELIDGTSIVYRDGSKKFSGGGINLGRTGINSGLSEDIYRRGIPGVDNKYSIGAFEQQYISTLSTIPVDTDPLKGEDIYISENKDIIIHNDDLVLVGGIDALIQRISIKLKFFFAEWYLDVTVGIKYFESILIKNPDLDLIENIFKAAILDEEEIIDLEEFQVNYDNEQREFSVIFKASSIYGDVQRIEEFTI